MRKAITADAFRQAIAPEELLALARAKCGAMTLGRKLAAFEGFALPHKPAAIREPAGRSVGRERNLEPFQHPPSGELVTARHLNLLPVLLKRQHEFGRCRVNGGDLQQLVIDVKLPHFHGRLSA